MNPLHLSKLVLRLEARRRALAALQGHQVAEAKRLETFPMGPGCGTAAKRRVQGREIDASVRRATEIVRLSTEVAQLEAQVDAYRDGRIDERGRQILGADQLRGLVAAGEQALATRTLKGRVLGPEELEALRETLREYRRKLPAAERREANTAKSEAARARVRAALAAEQAS